MAARRNGKRHIVVLPAISRPRGTEKWSDRVAVTNYRALREAYGYAGREHQPRLPVPVREISPSPRQAQAIRDCLTVADELLRRFGQRPARISPSRIHLVPGSVVKRLAKDKNTRAFFYDGHIYLNAQYCRRIANLIGDLTHELAHAVSFIVMIFDPRSKLMAVKPAHLVGLQCSAIHLGIYDRIFAALNEAVTEIAAHNMRLMLIRYGRIVGKEADRLARYCTDRQGYGAFIVVLGYLLVDDQDRLPAVEARLIRDMFRCGWGFLTLLERRGLKDELLKLDGDAESLDTFIRKHRDALPKPA